MAKKTQERDLTKLEGYIGLSPEEALSTLKSCGHLLAFGGENKDGLALEVVRTLEGECGDEAALAALAAVLFLKKHGAAKTAMEGVRMYQDIAKERQDPSLRERVHNMEFMVYFADHGYSKGLPWPWEFPCPTIHHRAGLANVMLGLSMRELGRDHAATTEYVAACGIASFLDEGMKKKMKNRAKRRSA
jgi:hypothetical protein